MKRFILWIAAASVLLNLSGCAYAGAKDTEPPVLVQIREPEVENTIAQTETGETEAATVPTEPPEETYPPRDPEDEDFVRIVDYIPTARVELAYATVNNFAGCRIYDFTDAFLRYGTVKKLMKVSEELAEQGMGLIIWDGFRPASAQAKLWEICPDPTFVSHPVTGKRTHCRGNTVDISLYDLETGEELPVPTGYDNFSAYVDRDYSDCAPDAAANARLLENIMEKCGFTPYFAEWWHFADGTDYPVDEFFDPAVPDTWSANCEEYISLRDSPGGETMAKIPRGETMQLQSWSGKYAEVSWRGMEGYVLTSYIMPEDDSYFADCLDTAKPAACYSYERLLADVQTLEEAWPDVVTTDSIGVSALGRKIPVLRIGDPDARYHVLLQGAIHGREHLTAWLLMAVADYWLDHGILGYGDVCYHIIPMVNPDGVVISQTGALNGAQMEIYRNDTAMGCTSAGEGEYASRWKANGLGVDINRNFPAGWDSIDDRTGPSSQQYRGEKPFSAPEAAALRDYTLRYSFDATVSYHATGSLIYYSYGDQEPVNSGSKSLAKAVREVTGYDLAESNGVDGAGYKDWVIEELGIPSLTIEVGCEETALAEREIYSIFVRNYRVLPAIARWLQM